MNKLLPFVFGATALGWHNIQPFVQCPKLYQLKRVRKIAKQGLMVPAPLAIGLLLHVARAQWLHDGRKGALWIKAMESYFMEFPKNEGTPLPPASLQVAKQCFEAYVEHWAKRPFPGIKAIEHEIKPRPLTPDAPQWAWRGARLDSIETWKGKAWIGELKSTSDSANAVLDYYTLNGQTLLQAALWGKPEIEKFGPLGGILLDVIVKPRGDKPAKAGGRHPLPIENMEFALSWFRRDFTTWVMQTHLIDWNTTVERRPMCVGKYGPCEMRDLCLLGPRGTTRYVFGDGTPISKFKPGPGKEVPPYA